MALQRWRCLLLPSVELHRRSTSHLITFQEHIYLLNNKRNHQNTMQAISGTAEQPSGDVVKRVPSKKASVRQRADALLALRARTQSRDDVPSYIKRNRTDDSRSVESNVTEPSCNWSRAGSKMTAASTVAYNWDNIFEQIKADPSAARTDDGGVLPLHAACGAGAPLSVIKMLLDVYPEAAR